MCVDRRDFLRLSAGLGGAVLFETQFETEGMAQTPDASRQLHPQLRSMTDGVMPISDDERRARIEKAQRLMVENKIDAIYLESGSSLFYFTGVRWGNSEH